MSFTREQPRVATSQAHKKLRNPSALSLAKTIVTPPAIENFDCEAVYVEK